MPSSTDPQADQPAPEANPHAASADAAGDRTGTTESRSDATDTDRATGTAKARSDAADAGRTGPADEADEADEEHRTAPAKPATGTAESRSDGPADAGRDDTAGEADGRPTADPSSGRADASGEADSAPADTADGGVGGPSAAVPTQREAGEAEPEPAGRAGKTPGTDARTAARTDAGKAGKAGVSRRRRRLAAVVGVVGELLITAGLVLALFVVYSLWWTNVVANQEANRDSDAVRDQWAAEDRNGEGGGDDRPPVFDPEDGIGFLHVPAMTDDVVLVKEGVGLDVLNGGVAGFYDSPVESAMPWDEEGNFSLAAHRDGHGARFHGIDRIEEGDPIVFETNNTWYIYRAFAILPETSRYNTAVLDAVPEESGATEAGRYITLTTCTPLYTSRYRYVVWGELERTERVDADRTPPEELRAAD